MSNPRFVGNVQHTNMLRRESQPTKASTWNTADFCSTNSEPSGRDTENLASFGRLKLQSTTLTTAELSSRPPPDASDIVSLHPRKPEWLSAAAELGTSAILCGIRVRLCSTPRLPHTRMYAVGLVSCESVPASHLGGSARAEM